MRFEHVLVVGAGQMGGGIAQVVAASGRRVSLYDEMPGAVERALEAMERSLTKLAKKGGADPAHVLARVSPVEGLVAADLMIEAVVEDAEVKKRLFRSADEVLPPEAILASNTSSIPITSLAAATSRPDQVIGMHFFNPVPVLQLVEVIRAVQTSDETAAAIVELAQHLGKVPAEARDFRLIFSEPNCPMGKDPEAEEDSSGEFPPACLASKDFSSNRNPKEAPAAVAVAIFMN